MAIDRIKVDPSVCEGKATIRGMRITVDFVLKLLGSGHDVERAGDVLEATAPDEEIVRRAAEEGRVILTQDL